MREVACVLDNVVVWSYIHVRLVNNVISGINTSPDAIRMLSCEECIIIVNLPLSATDAFRGVN